MCMVGRQIHMMSTYGLFCSLPAYELYVIISRCRSRLRGLLPVVAISAKSASSSSCRRRSYIGKQGTVERVRCKVSDLLSPHKRSGIPQALLDPTSSGIPQALEDPLGEDGDDQQAARRPGYPQRLPQDAAIPRPWTTLEHAAVFDGQCRFIGVA